MKPQDLQSVPDLKLSDLVSPKRVPLIRRFTANVAAFRYKLWLIALREVSIYKHLIDNFDKLPTDFREYRLIEFLKKCSLTNRLISAAEKKMRKRIY